MLRTSTGQRTRLHKKIMEELTPTRKLIEGSLPDADSQDRIREKAELPKSVQAEFLARFESLSGRILEALEGCSDEEIDQESELCVDTSTEMARVVCQLSALLKYVDRHDAAKVAASASTKGLSAL